ncbi:hypothetical protein ACFX15_028584 [Malus domestica]
MMCNLKIDTCGEDAFFVSSYNGGVLAIADGVSGCAEQNVDPSFPKELMANASNFVGDEEVNNNPHILIQKAHAYTSSIGSAMVIIALLERNGTLKIANVGDCRLRVIVKVKLIFPHLHKNTISIVHTRRSLAKRTMMRRFPMLS